MPYQNKRIQTGQTFGGIMCGSPFRFSSPPLELMSSISKNRTPSMRGPSLYSYRLYHSLLRCHDPTTKIIWPPPLSSSVAPCAARHSSTDTRLPLKA